MSQINEEAPSPDLVEQKLDRALDAVADVIQEVLKTSSTSKFAEASRLCNVGQTLQRSKSKSMKDFSDDPEGLNIVDGNVIGAAGPYRMMPRHLALDGGMPDQYQIVRELMLSIGPYFKGMLAQQESRKASDEADELASLNKTLKSLPENDSEPRAMIKKRIKGLLDNMQVRIKILPEINSDENLKSPLLPTTKLPLVPADLPRGYQIGGPEPEDNDPPGVRAHADRNGGDGAFARACYEEDVDPRGLGG